MAFFHVDILTPNRALGLNLGADSVEINTEMGQIGVLARHENLLTNLAPGTLVLQNGEKKNYFFIANGVMRVTHDKINILSEIAEPAEDINIERAKKALEKSKEMLKDPLLTDGETIKYKRKVERAEARLKTAQLIGRH